MFVLIGIAALLLIFVIYTLAFGGGTKATTTAATSSTEAEVVTLPTGTKTPVIVPSTFATTEAPKPAAKPGGEYEIKSGDTLFQIIKSAYEVSDAEAYELISVVEAANPGIDVDYLSVGDVINLPAIGGAETSAETSAETEETTVAE